MDIQFKNVTYTYQAGTPLAHTALKNINLTIQPHQFTAIIGKTGSGKSTLIQHLNALLKPTEGLVRMGGRVITPKTSDNNLKQLRKKVGTVFQFPEAQLFEQTVALDIAFGPKNYGASEKEALELTKEILPVVGLDESYLDVSPFDLSGGQQRRVAIAGVLALQPEVLVLDEPTAGLDPKGQVEMMEMFNQLKKDKNTTIILVTHQMEDVAKYADDIIVLEDGQCLKQGPPQDIFKDPDILHKSYLDVPETIAFTNKLEKQYGLALDKFPLTTDELAQDLRDYFHKMRSESK